MRSSLAPDTQGSQRLMNCIGRVKKSWYWKPATGLADGYTQSTFRMAHMLTWVLNGPGPTQEKLYQLARETGVTTFATHDEGKSQLYFKGRLKQYKGLIPPLPIPALLSLNSALKKMNRLSATIDPAQPWAHPKADQWDSITLGGWMKTQMKNEKARNLFQIAAEAIFAVNPAEISMLFALFYTRSGRDFDTLMNIRNGAQQDRFLGGADLPARRVAEKLAGHIIFNAPVKSIQSGKRKSGYPRRRFPLPGEKSHYCHTPCTCPENSLFA